MPIRLNLLAEAHAAEEMRRRDPVKRALWLAALIIALILVWSSYLQLRATLANSDVTRVEAQMGSRTNEFQQILDNQKKTGEIDGRLRLLRQLAGNWFLNGTLLNTFQQTTVEDVQLIRLRVEQLYTLVEGTKTRTNDDNVVIPGRLPTDTEKTVVNLEGIDSSSNPGNQVNRFKSALATAKTTLAEAEIDIASGDLYSWVVNTLRDFKAKYKVNIPQFNPIGPTTEVNLMPNFPYKQTTLSVAGTAHFHDFGRFLADLENQFPHVRVLNLNLELNQSPVAEEQEMVSFKLDIVTLVKTNPS